MLDWDKDRGLRIAERDELLPARRGVISEASAPEFSTTDGRREVLGDRWTSLSDSFEGICVEILCKVSGTRLFRLVPLARRVRGEGYGGGGSFIVSSAGTTGDGAIWDNG